MFSDNVKKYRKHRGYSQEFIADKLGYKSFTTIQKWEDGTSEPPIGVVKKLADLLGVSMKELIDDIDVDVSIIPTTAQNAKHDWILEKWNTLDESGRKLVTYVIETESFRADEIKRLESQKYTKYMRLPLMDLVVSAGDGMELGDVRTYEYIDIPVDDIPDGASYLLTVKGHSMEPKYNDGDIVFVSAQTYVDEGEIGIFSVNSKGYIKKVGRGKLISLNPDYDDIEINEYDSYFPRGRVLGKYICD